MADIRLVSDSDKLELGGRTGGDLNLFHNSTNSFIENETGILYVTNKANTSLILGTNSTTAVTIDNSQNVTIAGEVAGNGTTLYAWQSQYKVLQASDGMSLASDTGLKGIWWNTYDTGTKYYAEGSGKYGARTYFSPADGSLYHQATTATGNAGATATLATVFTLTKDGTATFGGDINTTNHEVVHETGFGYDASTYKVIQFGGDKGGNKTISLGYDPTGNSNGSFAGSGDEILTRNTVTWKTPNDGNDGWHTPMAWDDGNVTMDGDGTIGTNNKFLKSRQNINNGVINLIGVNTSSWVVLGESGYGLKSASGNTLDDGGGGATFGGILQASASVNGNYISSFINSHVGEPYGINVHYGGAYPDGAGSRFITCTDVGGGTTVRMWVLSDGDVQNHDNSYGSTSDERIKQDIKDANSQWDDIKALKVRNFKKNDDVALYGDKAWEQIGVVAQELEESGMDKLVKEYDATDDDIKNNKDIKEGDKVKTVKYSVLYMKAIKALQEAMIRIEALENA